MGFIGRIEIYELDGWNGEWWCLLADLTYEEEGFRWTAVAGSLTNFASIPRFLWAIWPPTGKYNRATVIHDDLCHRHPIGSRQTHLLFARMLKACEVGLITRVCFAAMVYLFGPRFKAGDPPTGPNV